MSTIQEITVFAEEVGGCFGAPGRGPGGLRGTAG